MPGSRPAADSEGRTCPFMRRGTVREVLPSPPFKESSAERRVVDSMTRGIAGMRVLSTIRERAHPCRACAGGPFTHRARLDRPAGRFLPSSQRAWRGTRDAERDGDFAWMLTRPKGLVHRSLTPCRTRRVSRLLVDGSPESSPRLLRPVRRPCRPPRAHTASRGNWGARGWLACATRTHRVRDYPPRDARRFSRGPAPADDLRQASVPASPRAFPRRGEPSDRGLRRLIARAACARP